MQANRGDIGLDLSDAGAYSRDVLEAGPPSSQHGDDAVHELNEIRTDALRLIDEGGFSYVASPWALPLAHDAPLQLVSC